MLEIIIITLLIVVPLVLAILANKSSDYVRYIKSQDHSDESRVIAFSLKKRHG